MKAKLYNMNFSSIPATRTVSLEVFMVFSGRLLSLHDIAVPL